MRAHCKAHPPTDSRHKKLSEATKRILAKECKITADFTVPQVLLEPKKRIARFPPNPGEYPFHDPSGDFSCLCLHHNNVLY